MTRIEIFNFIRKNNLQDEVQKRFGKNFTNMKSALLEDYISTVKEAKKVTANTEAGNTAGKAADTSSKATTASANTAEVEAYNTLKNKYDSLVGAVAAMLCSIDNEETAHDLQDAINNIQTSLAKD